MLIKQRSPNIYIPKMWGLFLKNHKIAIVIICFALALCIIATVLKYNQSTIGRELGHSNWPIEALETKDLNQLLPFIGNTVKNQLTVLLTRPPIPNLQLILTRKTYKNSENGVNQH